MITAGKPDTGSRHCVHLWVGILIRNFVPVTSAMMSEHILEAADEDCRIRIAEKYFLTYAL